MKTKNNKHTEMILDVVKASRRASRNESLENSNGFVATHKVKKSKKAYSRKNNKKVDF